MTHNGRIRPQGKEKPTRMVWIQMSLYRFMKHVVETEHAQDKDMIAGFFLEREDFDRCFLYFPDETLTEAIPKK